MHSAQRFCVKHIQKNSGCGIQQKRSCAFFKRKRSFSSGTTSGTSLVALTKISPRSCFDKNQSNAISSRNFRYFSSEKESAEKIDPAETKTSSDKNAVEKTISTSTIVENSEKSFSPLLSSSTTSSMPKNIFDISHTKSPSSSHIEDGKRRVDTSENIEEELSPPQSLALSYHRLLIRSLYRIAKSDARFVSVNCDLTGLQLRFLEEFQTLSKDYRITKANADWVSVASFQSNPFSMHPSTSPQISILSEGDGKLEGKYHLIGDRVSTTEVQNPRTEKPIFLNYDVMFLGERQYLRCPITSVEDENENGKKSSIHKETSTPLFENTSFGSLRAAIRNLLKESAESPTASLDSINDVGFKAVDLANTFRRDLKSVAREKRKQSKLLNREFEKLKSLSKKTDTAKIRYTKDRIKELWLNHPDPMVRQRLFQVCRDMGRLDGTGENLSESARRACIAELDEILGLDCSNVETLHVRACVFLMEENYPACLEDLQQILILEPRHFPTLYMLMDLQLGRKQEPEALDTWNKLYKLCPRDPDLPNAKKLGL